MALQPIVLAAQSWGLEFRSQHPHSELGIPHTPATLVLSAGCGKHRDRRISGLHRFQTKWESAGFRERPRLREIWGEWPWSTRHCTTRMHIWCKQTGKPLKMQSPGVGVGLLSRQERPGQGLGWEFHRCFRSLVIYLNRCYDSCYSSPSISRFSQWELLYWKQPRTHL